MDKKQVQKRVLKDGKPLALSKFSWDEETKTFSSSVPGLVIDFKGVDDCTFNTRHCCEFYTGHNCTFNTGSNCIFYTGSNCIFKTGGSCKFDTGDDCTFYTGSYCTFDTYSGCKFDTGPNCIFKTYWGCEFNTAYNCIFKTGNSCIFNTGPDCVFKTCWGCEFNTGDSCTFDTGPNCIFDTGPDCVIINRNLFEVITPEQGQVIQICPDSIPGHLVDGIYNGKPHIIADGILSKIVNQRGSLYKVINYGKNSVSYLIKEGDVYSHGKTLKEARESLVYKVTDRDTSAYEGLPIDSKHSKAECIKMYRTITGACSEGAKYFVENSGLEDRDCFTISDVIQITEGQYRNKEFKQFFKKGELENEKME